jgi:Heterokaryon incompatibility protein (HET)
MDDMMKPKEAVPNEPLAEDQLCSTCSTISFEAALLGYCGKCAPQNLQSQGVINLGTVQRILDNTSCPACRLVSSCISSYGETIMPDSVLRFLSRRYPFELREKVADLDSDSGPLTLVSNLKWLDIVTCGHDIGPTNGKRLSIALECEFVSTGVLIPAGPPYHCKEGDAFSGRRDSRYIYARQVSPAVDIELVRKWMAYCATHHNEICETRFVNPQARKDIRLIDVQQRQLVMGDLGFNYMALSYVWGPNTKPVLTKSTLGKHLRPGGLAEEDIPLTIWDAMELVADLGERYLWVDSVCIIQDDQVDKQRELPMMGEIYNHAMLVIVAAVENAHSGLPGRGERKRQWSRPTENIQGLHFTTGQPELLYKLDTAIWNTRGWTFQEAQLARRALVFTEYQVYWNCRQEAWCEDRFTEFLDVRHIPFSHNSLFSLSKKKRYYRIP